MNNSTDTHGDDIHRNNKQNAEKSPEELEREVDQARARLGRTAHELSDRLSPGELMDQALGMAREHGGEFGRNLGAQVKNNPLPLILTSIGISWMMMSSGKQGAGRSYGHYDTGSYDTGRQNAGADPDGHSFKDALADGASKAQDKAAAIGDRVHDANANMKESAQNLRESLTQFYRDQPLIAGSLGIAIGAALGAMVPPSEIEDNVFGEASDRSVDAAKAAAENKYDEVRESVR